MVLEPPTRPPTDATTEQWLAYLDAAYAFDDRVSDIANRAFERAFLKEIRKP